MTTDLLSDMLVRIKNASLAKHSFTLIPYSELNIAVLKVLKKEAYILDYENNEDNKNQNNRRHLKVFLKYKGWWLKKPFFSSIQRISKPGQRIFSGYRDFQKKMSILKYEQGIAILSTSLGVMSHLKALQLKKGGEILCYIE
jgi:small subunit ribosomal protein S8